MYHEDLTNYFKITCKYVMDLFDTPCIPVKQIMDE